MTRSLLLTTILLVGCTRPNPAFDGDDGVEADESSGLACEFQPTDGLDLKYGDLSYFGGVSCPPSAIVWASVASGGGGMVKVETCDEGCANCGSGQPLSIFPLLVTDYLPSDPKICLRLEAEVSLGASPDVCQWGALSVYDAEHGTPYLIATTHSSPPTESGAKTLAGLIPEPVDVGACNCDDVGLGNDCCYQAATPPLFFGYPWGDLMLHPGDYGALPLANNLGLDHYFKVIQAQTLHTCESSERALSWAVVGVVP